ncbi:hypothetical protein [Nocardia testacea]|uniref:hypothetical protein n=1 Tax=Nocardia testacea TaxID=248551 RepID=UPI0033E4FC76
MIVFMRTASVRYASEIVPARDAAADVGRIACASLCGDVASDRVEFETQRLGIARTEVRVDTDFGDCHCHALESPDVAP